MNASECQTLVKTNVSVLEKLYVEFSSYFYEKTGSHPFNLKRTSITSLANNAKMLDYTMLYRSELSNWLKPDIVLTRLALAEESKCKLGYRTKLEDSLLYKIKWYMGRQDTFYVLKSINDLFGARLIIPGFQEFEQETYNYYKSKEDERVRRCYIRDDEPSYHGLHLYIGSSNEEFPWELQIWDSGKEENNLKSHAYHEQKKEAV